MNTMYVDSTYCTTDLCLIGGKHNTDKSPFASHSACCNHRKGYTAVYAMLLAPYNGVAFNLAEIGIEQGSSLMMWSEKYPCAHVHGFECCDDKIHKCRNLGLPNVTIHKTDASDAASLHASFAQCNATFDVIIDDSSHCIEHQNNIISCVHKYLKPGGMLIIEDINRSTHADQFHADVHMWSFCTFIICDHVNKHCHDNDKILMLVKR
jgi:SAM-dependent methyltransferase